MKNSQFLTNFYSMFRMDLSHFLRRCGAALCGSRVPAHIRVVMVTVNYRYKRAHSVGFNRAWYCLLMIVVSVKPYILS